MKHEDETAARRVLEERVAHLEKTESIGRLAGAIAHDFNNLLTAILGFTEVLLANRPADHPDRPPLEEIQKAGLRAASLTQQLLAFGFPAAPLRQATATEPAELAEPAERADDVPLRGNETVLLVEDEDAVRRIMSTVLQRQGYTVLEASTPVVALELFERHAEDIALLLTDVVMPVMGGPALAQRLVAVRPSLRVLFVSGYTGLVPPQIRSPKVGFLNKPFQTGVLAARVREMLSPRAGSRAV